MRALVLCFLAATAVAGQDPLFGPLDDERTEAAASSNELPPDLPGDAAAEARRILERTFRVTFCVSNYEALSREVAAVLDRPVLDAAGQEAIRGALRSGAIRVEHVATASGTAGEPLSVTSGERLAVIAEREIDSAQGAVAVYPTTGAVRIGFRATARLGIVAGRGVRVAYDLVLADDPVVERVDDTGGEVDRVAVTEIRARGALRLVPGEAAPILVEDGAGAGVMVLIRLDGPDEVLPALIDVPSGVTLAVGGHLVDGAVRGPTWEPTYDWMYDDEVNPGPDDSLEARWDDLLESVGYSARWWDLPEGLRAGVLEPSIRDALEAALTTGAALRGRRAVLEVVRTGRERARLPLGPGEPFEVSRSVRRSVRGRTEVASGCQDSSAAVARTGTTREGFCLAGRAGVDGTVDVEMVARDVLNREVRVLSLTRVVSGYRAIEREPVRIPLVTDAILRVRGALPEGTGSLPGGVRVKWSAGESAAISVPEDIGVDDLNLGRPVGGRGFLPPRSVASALADRVRPIPLDVAGRQLSLRPDVQGVLVDVRRRSRVTTWRSEGWCGMRVRVPVASDTPGRFGLDDEGLPEEPLEGTWVRIFLFPGPDGPEISLAGEIGGPPDALVAFDPGDGEVEIVRHPRLRVAVEELPLGGGGVVARGAGLSLEIRRPDREPGLGPHRHAVCRRPGSETLLRTGAGGFVEAGGVTLLPTGIGGYASNHEMGEAATMFSRMRDGVRLAWLEDNFETPALSLEIQAPPRWREVPVKTVLAPARPGSELRTLVIGRRTTQRLFYLEPGRGLRAASATGSALFYEIEAGGDS